MLVVKLPEINTKSFNQLFRSSGYHFLKYNLSKFIADESSQVARINKGLIISEKTSSRSEEKTDDHLLHSPLSNSF